MDVKIKKAKWIAQYLGDKEPWDDTVDWEDIEFEVSVVREDYEIGLGGAGWADINNKIVLFDNINFVPEDRCETAWYMRVAEAVAEGLNAKGL